MARNDRLEFSRAVRRQVEARAGGCCENKRCGAVLKKGEGEYDHILPAALGGEATVANCMLICRQCHKDKTAADVKRIRKADRQRDKDRGTYIRSKGKTPMPGSKASRFKRTINGDVIDRRTGEVL